jgi:hypothetical protein
MFACPVKAATGSGTKEKKDAKDEKKAEKKDAKDEKKASCFWWLDLI